MGKYEGTVRKDGLMVPFRHCLENGERAPFGCVGKVCARYLSSLVVSLQHATDTTRQANARRVKVARSTVLKPNLRS